MQKLFVLVREDISLSHPSVQAGHAVAEFVMHSDGIPRVDGYEIPNWDKTLVYLSVKNSNRLDKIMYRLQVDGVPFTEWREPDLNNEITAIACLGHDHYFRNLKLIGS